MEDPRRYMRAMTCFRDRIENGTFKPHELIPSIAELAEQTGHSRHTVSKALRLLQARVRSTALRALATWPGPAQRLRGRARSPRPTATTAPPSAGA